MTRLVFVLAVLGWTATATLADPPDGPHLKLRVILDNGSRLVGVVRDGALYEVRAADGRYLPAVGPRVSGAGFRLWYVDDMPGYLWIRHDDVKRFEEIALFTDRELFSVERELRRKAGIIVIPSHRLARAAAEAEALGGGAGAIEGGAPASGSAAGRTTGPAIGPPLPPGVSAPESAAPLGPAAAARALQGTADSSAARATDAAAEAATPTRGEILLQRFPPWEGWLPERREEIERRKWVLGVFPTPDEKAFLENYAEWKEAYDDWLANLIREHSGPEESTRGAALPVPSTGPNATSKATAGAMPNAGSGSATDASSRRAREAGVGSRGANASAMRAETKARGAASARRDEREHGVVFVGPRANDDGASKNERDDRDR